jgi:hypothetical protein
VVVVNSRPARLAAVVARRPSWLLALAVVAGFGGAYLILAPQSGDLAAASYRSYLFARDGLTIWDNGWYGGHYLPAYSLLSPELGAWLGPRLVTVAASALAVLVFARLIDGRFTERTVRLASLGFALAVGVEVFSARVPFDLGLALGLGALWAAARRRRAAALALAGLCSLASPVAGVFLGLAGVAWALSGSGASVPRGRAADGAAATRAPIFALMLTASALLPIAALAVAFPDRGTQPYAASSFWPEEALVLAIWALLPREARTLRLGAALYAVMMLAAFVVTSPLGSNVERLGALMAAPFAVFALLERRPRLLLALAPALLFWPSISAAEDLAAAASDPSVSQSYYAPLLGHLRELGALDPDRPVRIEVVPTLVHWDARWVASEVTIARGWERQLDSANDALFYSSRALSAARYEAWLRADAISYVALPDAPLDSSAAGEAALLRHAAPPYLLQVWHSAHWRLFAVREPVALAQPPAVLTRLSTDSFTLETPRPGSFLVRVRFTPYWALERGAGCVLRSADGFTVVQARTAGSLRVGIAFSLTRVFEHGPRCRA